MNVQSLLALIVVSGCAIWMLRGWLSFWISLARASGTEGVTHTGCHGCELGCGKQAKSPCLVELKRELR